MCMENAVTPNIFSGSNTTICDYCFREFNVIWEKRVKEQIEYIHIYSYNEHVKAFLYRLKGLADIELSPVFIERFKLLLRMKYFNFILIPAPSSKDSETARGFNHVKMLFFAVKRPFLDLFTKKTDFKQSDFNYNERQNVINKIAITNGNLVKNKRILLVDDLHTTGATLAAMIKLLRPFKPKMIKVLTIAKTEDDF